MEADHICRHRNYLGGDVVTVVSVRGRSPRPKPMADRDVMTIGSDRGVVSGDSDTMESVPRSINTNTRTPFFQIRHRRRVRVRASAVAREKERSLFIPSGREEATHIDIRLETTQNRERPRDVTYTTKLTAGLSAGLSALGWYSNYRAGSSNYLADSSNYQLSVGPGRLIIQLSAWYFQGGSSALRTFLARAAKCRTTGLRHARTSVRAALRLCGLCCAPLHSPSSRMDPAPQRCKGCRQEFPNTHKLKGHLIRSRRCLEACVSAPAPALAASRTTPTPRLR